MPPTPPPVPTKQPTANRDGQTPSPQPAEGGHFTETPKPAKRLETVEIKPGAIIRELIEQAHDEGKPPGQIIREVVKERRHATPARRKSGKP